MYIFILILSLTTYVLGKSLKRLEPFYLLTVVLALVCGLRGEFVGVDTNSYHKVFSDLKDGNLVYILEQGYLLFLKFIISIEGTQQLVFLLFSSFTIYCYSKFILRYSKNPYLSLLIFVFLSPFYLSTFNQVRQYLAIGIFLAYLIPLIQNKQLIKYILVILGTTFFIHASSILLIPFYFVLNKSISPILKVSYIVIFNSIISILTVLLLKTHYGYFITKRVDIEIQTSLFLIQIFISFFILLFQKRISKGDNSRKIFFNMAYFSLFLLVPIFINNNIPKEIFGRMNSYVFPFIIIIVPDILELFNEKSKTILTSVVIVLLSSYFYRGSTILGEIYNLLPYDSNLKLFNFT